MNNKSGVLLNLDKERLLRYDLNTLCDIENEFGTLSEALAKIDEIERQIDEEEHPIYNFNFLRRFLYLGLKHEDENLDEKEIASWLQFDDAMSIISIIPKAMFKSLPEKENLYEDDSVKN